MRRTLGPVSAKFLNQIQAMGKTFFTLTDAEFIYGKGGKETRDFINDLTKRGLLAHINVGVYSILQAGQEINQLSNWPLIADRLAASDNYFISYYSAMRLHGMMTHALTNVYVTMPKRRRDKIVSNINYHFIYCKREHFWGC